MAAAEVGTEETAVKMARALKVCGRVLVWGAGFLLVAVLLWFAANRFLDERPDPRREAFLLPGTGVPDEENLAVGIAGLGAPSGADFMKFGSEVRKLHESYADWHEIERNVHGLGELKLTVESEQIRCWIDPDWEGWKGFKECLPFDKAPRVLADNRELLDRYKRLYRLERHVAFGFREVDLMSFAKLAVAEMRLDMRARRYEAAYAKWRDHFRFTRNYLRGQNGWIGKSIGMVDLAFNLQLLEDLLVMRPSLSHVHYAELLELLRPRGIGLIEPDALARAQYVDLERYLRTPYARDPELSDTLDWLGWKLGQEHRILNRYLAYSMDYGNVLRLSWTEMPGTFSKLRERYVTLGWNDLIDPFGAILLLRQIHWQLKLTSTLRQVYIEDGRLRLASLVVRIVSGHVADEQIPHFLLEAPTELNDPFSGKSMRWDAKYGRLYFVTSDDGCEIAPFRVPAWNTAGKRRAPKPADWWIC